MFLGRIVGPGEPLWLHEDRMWALAWDHVEQDRCGGCGHPLSETTAEDADDAYLGHAIRCQACKAIADKTESVDGKRGLLGYAERVD